MTSAGCYRAIGDRVRNWGRWGPEDRLGTLNLITPERVAHAATLVRRGAVFDLGMPIGVDGPPQPPGSVRFEPIHLMLRTPDTDWSDGMIGADDMLVVALQSVTQWDGLGHCGYDGAFYNGVPASTVTARGSSVLSIDQLAARGIVGRGVLLDIARLRGVEHLELGDAIEPEELEAAERHQGVTVGGGDILLVRTGWIRHWLVHRDADSLWSGQPGLSFTCAEWLHDREVAAVLADNTGVESIPAHPDAGGAWPLHCIAIRDMGMTLGEMAVLDDLASDCAADGVWEFLFTAPPLKVQGGVGSPITPLAIK